MHRVSCPRVATAYELFNKILVHNNLYIIRPKIGATSTKLKEGLSYIDVRQNVILSITITWFHREFNFSLRTT
jgi:hypothetical protein